MHRMEWLCTHTCLPRGPKCQGHGTWWRWWCIDMSTSPEGGMASCQQWQRNSLPPMRPPCWPGWVAGVAWATVESEGGRGRPPWGRKGGLLGCCGTVTVILPVGRAWRLFCGTSVHTRRFCCSVHRWKCGWLTGRAAGRADFWPFPELREAVAPPRGDQR